MKMLLQLLGPAVPPYSYINQNAITFSYEIKITTSRLHEIHIAFNKPTLSLRDFRPPSIGHFSLYRYIIDT